MRRSRRSKQIRILFFPSTSEASCSEEDAAFEADMPSNRRLLFW